MLCKGRLGLLNPSGTVHRPCLGPCHGDDKGAKDAAEFFLATRDGDRIIFVVTATWSTPQTDVRRDTKIVRIGSKRAFLHPAAGGPRTPI